ncbi:MAG: acyltransferase [Paludibacter sp.]|nr:acyltransferase [Paludibacter sp.]
MTTKSNKIQYLDTLRTFATLGVIIIHITSALVNMTWNRNIGYWWIGNIVESAMRFAVPMFLLLSGATMLGKEYKLSEFYKRRLMRVLVPFLFWMIIYWIFRWTMLPPKQQPHEFYATLHWAVTLFLKEGISKHFWYIYMILCFYLLIPFVGKVLRKCNNTSVLFVLITWVLLAFALRKMPINMYGWAGDYGSKLLSYSLYFGYLVLGFYLNRISLPWGRMRLPAIVIFILTVAVSSVVTYLLSFDTHKLNMSIYSYLSVNTIVQTIALFICIKELKIDNKIVSWTQIKISNYSYGIYLVHIIVIGILFRQGIYWNFAHPIFSLPLLMVLVLVISFGIIWLLRKIPMGKYISG